MIGLSFLFFVLMALIPMEMQCFGISVGTTWESPDDDEMLDLRPIFAQECGLMCKFQKMLKSMEYFVCTFARTQARARRRLLLQKLAQQQFQDPMNYEYSGLESEPRKNQPQDQKQAEEKGGEEHKDITT
uniref:Uncharacterized protein n=1 Tax=Romanomermis culicivorax TaxID=13658 RepID=A0A915I5I0_ROMCU